MMEGYVSDKEQIELIKNWWKEQGKFIAIAIVCGLAIGWGWRYWHTVQQRRAENASMIYQSVLQADQAKQSVTVQGGAKILMDKFSSSPYASLAAMIVAKEAVLTKHYGIALQKLQWVADHSKESRLKNISLISAARIFIEMGKTDRALGALNAVHSTDFSPLVNWVKGDAYRHKGDAVKAKQYYTKAKEALQAVPPAAAVLNMNLAQPLLAYAPKK